MLFQQPNADDDQHRGPQPGDTMQVKKIEIAEQIKTADNDERNTAPELAILHSSELLLQSIDRGFKRDSLRAEHALLGGVISLERHIEIEPGSGEAEKRCLSGVGERN